MFPIAIMYYYGTNLDNRFSVPDFWPKPEQTNRIPFEKEEIHSELERLRQRRLFLRDKRLEQERSSGRRGQDGENGGSLRGETVTGEICKELQTLKGDK